MALESFAVGYNGNNKILQMFSNAISKLAKDLRHKWVRTNDDEEYNALRGDINCETFDRRGDSYPHFEAVKNYPTYSQVLNFGNLSSFGEEGTDIKEHTMPSYNITYVRIGTGGCITANESRDAYPNITYAFKGLSPFTSYTISFDIFQMPQYINQDTSYAYGVLIANDEFNVGCPQISENWYDSIEKKWYYRWAFDLPSGDIAGGGKLFTDISQNMKAPVDSFAYGKYQIKGLYQSFFRTENTHSYSLNTYSNSKGEIYFQVLLTAVNDLQFGWENFKIENLKISQYVQNKTYLTITDIYSYADQWIKYDKNSNAIYDLKDEDPDSRLGKDNDLCVRYSNHPDDSISIVADQDYSCWQVTDITEVTEGGFNVTIEGHNRYVDPEAQYPVVQKPYTKILLTDLEPGVEYTLNYRYYTPNMEDVTYRGAGNYIRFDYLEPQRIFWAIMPPDDPDEYHPYLRTDSITFIPMNSTMTIYICERGYNLSNEDKTLIIHFFVNKSSLDNFFVKLKGRWESVYSGGGGSSSLAGLNDVSLTNLINGQGLKWDAFLEKWVNSSDTGASSLAGLSDVSLNSVANGQILAWNRIMNRWTNVSLNVPSIEITPMLTSGVPIAKITLDGNDIYLYAPEGGGGGDSDMPVLLNYTLCDKIEYDEMDVDISIEDFTLISDPNV